MYYSKKHKALNSRVARRLSAGLRFGKGEAPFAHGSRQRGAVWVRTAGGDLCVSGRFGILRNASANAEKRGESRHFAFIFTLFAMKTSILSLIFIIFALMSFAQTETALADDSSLAYYSSNAYSCKDVSFREECLTGFAGNIIMPDPGEYATHHTDAGPDICTWCSTCHGITVCVRGECNEALAEALWRALCAISADCCYVVIAPRS
jgi:hypothetical protein